MQRGTLFTEDFLFEGIKQTQDWKDFSDVERESTIAKLKEIFAPFHSGAEVNEADTEERVIYRVLDALGWRGLVIRQPTMAARGREDVPDGLLLPDEAALGEADKAQRYPNKFRFGVAVCESKKWERGLDAGQGDDVPSTQMLRYLTRADAMSDGKILWGILTNGRVWRLYWQKAKSRSEQFLEFDLGALLNINGYKPDLFAPNADEAKHLLAVFILMFRREAFLPTRDKGRSFHDVALEEGKNWEARVAKSLSELTFSDVFPGFCSALSAAKPEAALPDIRQAALTLLYRLLFVLYAEDRDLLPKRDKRYEDYGLFKGVRQDVAAKIDGGATFSAKAAHYWNHCRTLFGLIDEGDPGIGLPPYNGGLFDKNDHMLLDSSEIPDAAFAPLLDKLSRTKDSKFINYRDLSVQQLGSIYERLLEYEPYKQNDGSVGVRLNPFARKGSGSYYTPDELVALIVDRTVGELVRERREAFQKKATALKSEKTPIAERLEKLKQHDLASALLELKVCDPAMGSGHFLVHLVDYLTDAVIEALAEAPKDVSWAEYSSPLGERIGAIRARILAEAEANKWIVRPDQLEDRMIVRRMVLKRAIYGVDKNEMAVELAKVSLWLHTFTAGAPLSFLDHHLRCGDSLFGEWVLKTERELSETAGMFVRQQVVAARQAARLMLDIEAAADADLAEVRKSEERFSNVRDVTDPLIRLLSFWHACRWLPNSAEQRTIKNLLVQEGFGKIDDLLSGRAKIKPGKKSEAASELLSSAMRLAAQERFLHWEVAFPGVWTDWESSEPKGGFDAVIGNPPWDRLKMQEVEWFAARRPEIALAQRATDRKRMIEKLKKHKDPLYGQYELALQRADQALDLARNSGEYPLLGRGDINIYSLFVERSLRLIRPDGFVGLLTPIGIGTDKTAAKFFSYFAEKKRIFAFLSFENKRGWLFGDVHHEDQPTAFVVGGKQRETPNFAFGVKLHAIPEDAYLKNNRLSAADCREANPNTGTIPIFRSRKDSEIVAGIYIRLPILAPGDGDDGATWPVRYSTIFHMTRASWMFRTREQLEATEKAYPIGSRKWKSAKGLWEPLFEGKMVSIFNHRYASVGINPKNVSGQGVTLHSSLKQLEDPDFVNQPRYWVPQQTIRYEHPYALGFNDVCNTNNARSLLSAIVPKAGYGNKLPILAPVSSSDLHCLVYLVANLNSFVCDFVARQKIQSRNLNKYILNQLPVVPADAYAHKFGKRKAADIVRDHVLRLSYTANDLADFARDIGHVDKSGKVLPPFKWDEEERRHLRARLDALYFLLYGITDRDDVRYILSTFPIVMREDDKKYGRCRTEDLILAYMNALEAGDTETVVAL